MSRRETAQSGRFDANTDQLLLQTPILPDDNAQSVGSISGLMTLKQFAGDRYALHFIISTGQRGAAHSAQNTPFVPNRTPATSVATRARAHSYGSAGTARSLNFTGAGSSSPTHTPTRPENDNAMLGGLVGDDDASNTSFELHEFNPATIRRVTNRPSSANLQTTHSFLLNLNRALKEKYQQSNPNSTSYWNDYIDEYDKKSSMVRMLMGTHELYRQLHSFLDKLGITRVGAEQYARNTAVFRLGIAVAMIFKEAGISAPQVKRHINTMSVMADPKYITYATSSAEGEYKADLDNSSDAGSQITTEALSSLKLSFTLPKLKYYLAPRTRNTLIGGVTAFIAIGLVLSLLAYYNQWGKERTSVTVLDLIQALFNAIPDYCVSILSHGDPAVIDAIYAEWGELKQDATLQRACNTSGDNEIVIVGSTDFDVLETALSHELATSTSECATALQNGRAAEITNDLGACAETPAPAPERSTVRLRHQPVTTTQPGESSQLLTKTSR